MFSVLTLYQKKASSQGLPYPCGGFGGMWRPSLVIALSEAFLNCKKKAERRSILLNSKEFHTIKADAPKILLTGPLRGSGCYQKTSLSSRNDEMEIQMGPPLTLQALQTASQEGWQWILSDVLGRMNAVAPPSIRSCQDCSLCGTSRLKEGLDSALLA